jgi:chaperonin cofactor prefoldin
MTDNIAKRIISNYEKTIELLEHQIQILEASNKDLKQRIKSIEQAKFFQGLVPNDKDGEQNG